MTLRRRLRPRRTSSKRCNVLIALAVFLVAATHAVHAYDFTNLGAAEFKKLRRANKTSTQLNATIPAAVDQLQEPDDEPDRHISSSQTPIHWFFSKLYGLHGANETMNGTTTNSNATFTNGSTHAAAAAAAAESTTTKRVHHLNTTYPFVRIPADVTGSSGANDSDAAAEWPPMVHEHIEDEAVRYNVSFLGLKDPFARHATKLSYDYRIDVGEPSKNGRGSIVSLLNGTIYPLGSVGAMSAVGWSGGSNETRTHGTSPRHSANGTRTSNSTAATAAGSSANHTGTTDTAGTGDKHAKAASSPASSSVTPHSDGMTGIWLAFTSQHAVTGGYTLHSKHVSVTNNVLFHNVTFRSNFTIDAHGRFSFVFTMGTVDESDQMSDDDGDGTFTKSNKPALTPSPKQSSGNSPGSPTETAKGKTSTTHAPPGSPIRLNGPHCTPMKGTRDTEAAFRMRCEGAKVDTSMAS